jgi:hypothetical protein
MRESVTLTQPIDPWTCTGQLEEVRVKVRRRGTSSKSRAVASFLPPTAPHLACTFFTSPAEDGHASTPRLASQLERHLRLPLRRSLRLPLHSLPLHLPRTSQDFPCCTARHEHQFALARTSPRTPSPVSFLDSLPLPPPASRIRVSDDREGTRWSTSG